MSRRRIPNDLKHLLEEGDATVQVSNFRNQNDFGLEGDLWFIVTFVGDDMYAGGVFLDSDSASIVLGDKVVLKKEGTSFPTAHVVDDEGNPITWSDDVPEVE